LLWRYRTLRTVYGRATGETESAGSATMEQDHVLPVGRRWERQSQCVVVQLSSKITYCLWADDGRNGVSRLFCSYQARSRTGCGRRRSQRVVVQLSSKITYRLCAGNGRDGVYGLLCS